MRAVVGLFQTRDLFSKKKREAWQPMSNRSLSEKICHCFDYTVDDILKDIEANGKSTIVERIVAEKKKGSCQCAIKNPKGQ